MPFFKSTSRRSKDTSPGGGDGDAKGGKPAVPRMNLDEAASKIEARQRGKLARKKTESMKAHRALPADNPFAALLKKCLPCL